MLFASSERLKNYSKDPAVVTFDGKYYLYHSIPPRVRGEDCWGIGIAESYDLENWQICGEIEPEKEYEKNGICAPGAIVFGGKVHLFYQTYGNRENDAICHAVSNDGINFVRDEKNPVFRPTNDWCCGRAIDADVCIFNSRLYLYCATRDKEYKKQMLAVASASLSDDGEIGSFRQEKAQSVLQPELPWEGECIEAPAVMEYNGRLFMFYGGAYNNAPQQIGCAVSDDGINFTRLFSQPFLPNGKPGEWNSCESGHPFVFKNTDNRVYLFYQGNNDMGKTWYISKKEIWFSNDKLPVLKH